MEIAKHTPAPSVSGQAEANANAKLFDAAPAMAEALKPFSLLAAHLEEFGHKEGTDATIVLRLSMSDIFAARVALRLAGVTE